MKNCCGATFLLLLLLNGAGHLRAGQLDDDFLVTPFTVEDGLPQNTVIDIEQTPDGYLWLATYAGLVRFDGAQFTTFDSANTPGLSGGGVFMLDMDANGWLWSISDDWRLSRLKDGHFEKCSGRLGLPDVPVSLEGEAPDGEIVLEHVPPTEEEIRFKDGAFKAERKGPPFDPSKVDGSLSVDQRGCIWWRQGSGWAHCDHRALMPMLPASHTTNAVRIVRPRRGGGFWAATSGGLFAWKDGQWIRKVQTTNSVGSCTAMQVDQDGNVWLGTWLEGIWMIDTGGRYHHYTGALGKPFSSIRGLLCDREGNLWVGTEGSGLLRIRKRICEVVDAHQGLSAGTVTSVACDNKDRVWLIAQGRVSRVDPKDGNKVTPLGNMGLAWDLYCNPQGKLFAGAYSGQLWTDDHDALVPCGGTNAAAAITSLFEVEAGVLAVGTSQGLWVLSNSVMRPWGESAPNGSVKAMAKDARGTLFAGLAGAGLWKREAGRWSQIFKEDLTDVRALLAEGDALWVGTQQKGLWRLKGDEAYPFVPAATGLPRQISCLATDSFGWLWCGSGQGVFRVSLRELNRFAEGADELAIQHFGRSDGLPTSECASGRQQTVCRTSDGRLWFATSEGVAIVNPAVLTTNTLTPNVLVESAQVIGSRHAGGPERTLQFGPKPFAVPPGNNRLEIHYTALSLTAPERVQFRYRLEGLERDWVEAGARRIAYYQGLEPGHYTFHVISCNNDGLWNQRGATLEFSVQPWFWQSDWFKALVAAVVLGLVWLIYQVRLTRLAEVNRLRLRIARDLHDEIGANLGSIGLNVQLLMSDPEVGEQHRRDLAGIDQVTTQTAQAARDIVWMTNPDFDNVGGMIRRMRELTALMLAGRAWTFEEPTERLSDPLPLELRRNVFFAFKECLHNIVKHSKARTVGVTLRADGQTIELTVRDDGQGFDPAATASGTGLRNLRRRAEEMGGQMTIESKKDEGVKVNLRVPIHRAAGFWHGLRPSRKIVNWQRRP